MANNKIAVKRANNSSECPESPNINCTKANIIHTENQIKTNILYFLYILLFSKWVAP